MLVISDEHRRGIILREHTTNQMKETKENGLRHYDFIVGVEVFRTSDRSNLAKFFIGISAGFQTVPK